MTSVSQITANAGSNLSSTVFGTYRRPACQAIALETCTQQDVDYAKAL